MSSILLPVEERLKELAETAPNSFPVRTANYWNRYSALSNYLRTSIYPHINAGLACLSKSPGIYTDHGGDHFDEVIRYAGNLIEPTFFNGEGSIAPYDLYLLLSAIRLHDAGNIDGREEHERRVYPILKEAGAAVCPDDYEIYLISKIAEAHGGTLEDGDKDTIGALDELSGMGPINCRPRLVAALVRFSDEICEHSARASSHQVDKDTLPKPNRLFHLYAKAVKQASVIREQKLFRLKLVFDHAYLDTRFPTPQSEASGSNGKYLLDEALDRIQKLDTERIYCNRFLPPELKTETVSVTLEIVRAQTAAGIPIQKTLKKRTFEIQDHGYPSPNTQWREELSGLTGEAIAKEFTQEQNP